MARMNPEPTPEDRARVEALLAEPSEVLNERLKEAMARNVARARIERERRERRARLLRRFGLGALVRS
jgi:hypothetical protein